MDLQQLRCFLTVAEELHFGRAAERLHLTPSPVSRAVKELERELGVQLFVRRYHDVQLTSIGNELVGRVRDILDNVDGLAALAAGAEGDDERPVRIGGTYLSPPAVFDRFVAVVEDAFPGRTVDVTIAPSSELLPDLEEGRIDAALVHVPLERPHLATLVVARYTFVLAMRADDPCATASSLTLTDIAHRTLTVGAPAPQPVAMNRLYAYLREAGIESFHQMPDNNSAALATHIRRSRGLALSLHPSSGGSARIFDDPAFAIVPLEDNNLEFLLGLAWRRQDAVENDVVRRLLEAARDEWEGNTARF
ncbi:DNA-binding transcriptional LysR family regulator [Marmoricola sp. URHA0025 HA25]